MKYWKSCRREKYHCWSKLYAILLIIIIIIIFYYYHHYYYYYNYHCYYCYYQYHYYYYIINLNRWRIIFHLSKCSHQLQPLQDYLLGCFDDRSVFPAFSIRTHRESWYFSQFRLLLISFSPSLTFTDELRNSLDTTILIIFATFLTFNDF